MGFGKMLEEKMCAKGLKQADLVRLTGIPKTTLSSMLSRDNTKVDVQFFIKICKALECNPEDFSDEISISKPETYMLTDDEKFVVDSMRTLNDSGIEYVVKQAKFAADQPEYKKDNQSQLVSKDA